MSGLDTIYLHPYIMLVMAKLPVVFDEAKLKISKKPSKNAINYFQKALDELKAVIFYYRLFGIIFALVLPLDAIMCAFERQGTT